MDKQEYFTLVRNLKKELQRHKFVPRRGNITQCSCGWEYEDSENKYSKNRKFADHVAVRLAMFHNTEVSK